MAENSRTEINLQVGDVSNAPGVQTYVHIVTGESNVAKAKETVHHLIGGAPSDFNIYAVVSCTSSAAAEELKSLFERVWTGISTGSAEGEASQMIRAMVFEDNSAKATPAFSVHDNKFVMRITLSEEKQAEAEAMQEMVKSMAGHIFGHDQSIHIELDVGHEINTILHSQNMIVDALNSFRVNFAFHAAQHLFRDLKDVAENMGGPPQATRVLSWLELYESACLNIKFRSAAQLNEDFKTHVQHLSQKVNLNAIKSTLPPTVLTFLNQLTTHGNGDLNVFVSAGRLAAELKVHAPGAQTFFSN